MVNLLDTGGKTIFFNPETEVIKDFEIFEQILIFRGGLGMFNMATQRRANDICKEKMKKLKIGILTFHDGDNFGSVLQAYALQETVKQFNTDCVEIINYKQPYLLDKFKLITFNKSSPKKFIISLIDNMLFTSCRYLAKIRYRDFRDKYMNISSVKYFNSRDINGYDAYIVGSDQVWNNEIIRDDETFFLGFCTNNQKKIAYAASIGNNNICGEQLDWLKKHINNIDYISVREDSAMKTISSLTKKEVVQVLDPALLADQKLWDKFVKVKKYRTSYLLLYRIYANDELYNVANKIARHLNLKVIYIHYRSNNPKVLDYSNKPYKYDFKNVRSAGPKDFITLLKNANFIVTNSFHATAFSIIFNKNFIVVPDKERGDRLISLLNMLKLSKRIITSYTQVLENFNFEVNYETANEILSKEKEKSLCFLQNALKN
jgi:hypothetical protein